MIAPHQVVTALESLVVTTADLDASAREAEDHRVFYRDACAAYVDASASAIRHSAVPDGDVGNGPSGCDNCVSRVGERDTLQRDEGRASCHRHDVLGNRNECRVEGARARRRRRNKVEYPSIGPVAADEVLTWAVELAQHIDCVPPRPLPNLRQERGIGA